MHLQRNQKRLSQIASHLRALIEFGASPPLDEMNPTLLTAIVAQTTVYFTITWMSDYSTIFLMFLIKKASKSLEIYATDSKRLEFSGLPLLVLPRYQITASTR
jgi:hypothetical protein